jgi:hypothetical protein
VHLRLFELPVDKNESVNDFSLTQRNHRGQYVNRRKWSTGRVVHIDLVRSNYTRRARVERRPIFLVVFGYSRSWLRRAGMLASATG